MKRTGIARGDKPMKRSGFKRTGRSSFRRRDLQERAVLLDAQQAAHARDGGCVFVGMPGEGPPYPPPCHGWLTWHHVTPWRKGGPDHEDNLVTVCVGHHDWVENHPDAARSLGLLA